MRLNSLFPEHAALVKIDFVWVIVIFVCLEFDQRLDIPVVVILNKVNVIVPVARVSLLRHRMLAQICLSSQLFINGLLYGGIHCPLTGVLYV